MMTGARRPLALVVAMAKRTRVIGRAGGLPWHLPEDLKHFRAVTMGHAIVMGRATHVSIGRALPGRRNIVVTRDPAVVAEGCDRAASLEEALELAYATDPEPVIIGGAKLYEAAMDRVTKLVITEVQGDYEGDAHFPAFDERAFEEVERREGSGMVFRTLRRK